MNKNKINLFKALCNSTAKKLGVVILTLSLGVSAHVTSAQLDASQEEEKLLQLSERLKELADQLQDKIRAIENASIDLENMKKKLKNEIFIYNLRVKLGATRSLIGQKKQNIDRLKFNMLVLDGKIRQWENEKRSIEANIFELEAEKDRLNELIADAPKETDFSNILDDFNADDSEFLYSNIDWMSLESGTFFS